VKISVHATTSDNRDIRKVRKRQHQYPEFGHTQGEIQKKPAKSTLAFKRVGKLRKPPFDGFLSFTLSCFFS